MPLLSEEEGLWEVKSIDAIEPLRCNKGKVDAQLVITDCRNEAQLVVMQIVVTKDAFVPEILQPSFSNSGNKTKR